MPSEFTVWLSLVLVFAAVVVKIATANFIAGQKKQLSDLQSALTKVQDHLRTLIEHNASAKENLLFYQRREAEITKQLETLRPELDQYVESERKHLESLGYDPDEEGVTLEEIGAAAYQEGGDSGPPGDEAAPGAEPAPAATSVTGDEPAAEAGTTFQQEGGDVDPSLPICVVPAVMGSVDRLFLPDAVVTELLSSGIDVLERAALNRMVTDMGEDLAQILEREEYFRLGHLSSVRAIVIFNSKMRGSAISTATCRIVEIPSGKIILSKSYDQPGVDERSPDFESLTQTARAMCESISSAIKSPTPQVGS